MRIVWAYFLRTIFGTTGLVLAVLLSLGAFIEFVGQLDDIGVRDYGLVDAIGWVLLQLPTVLFQLLPIAVLLGTLLGLGSLAARSELIVLRAAGVSPRGIARAVLFTGVIFAVLGGIIGQYIAPPLERFSRHQRAIAKFGQEGLGAAESAWIRDKGTILNVVPPDDEHPAGEVLVFRLADGVLASVGQADSVRLQGDEWYLDNYAESRFTETAVEMSRARSLFAIRGINPDLLGLTVIREDTMTGMALWRYVQYLKRNDLDARVFETAFWTRIASIVAIAVMCVLAVPFVLGPLRTSGAGARLLAGLGIGLVWFLLSRTLADGSAVWNLNAVLAAWLPTLLLAAATLWLISRAR